jgi:hypothetical protein
VNSHFILIEETRNATANAGTHTYYGPFPTRSAAEIARDEHPNATAMEIVALDHLASIVDPCAIHPHSSGV